MLEKTKDKRVSLYLTLDEAETIIESLNEKINNDINAIKDDEFDFIDQLIKKIDNLILN